MDSDASTPQAFFAPVPSIPKVLGPILKALERALHRGRRVFLCPGPGLEALALSLGGVILEKGVGAACVAFPPLPPGSNILERWLPQLQRLGGEGDWLILLGGDFGPLGLEQLLGEARQRKWATLLLGGRHPSADHSFFEKGIPTLGGHLEALIEGIKGGINTASDPAYFCHGSSVVDEGAEVGEGSKIWHFSHVQSGAKIGKYCNLGQNVNVDRDAVIGDHVKIQNNVSIYKGVIVEDYAFLGPSCVFTNVINPRSHVPRRHAFRETRVGRGASIGANATVVCGVKIGPYAFIGAGAVVTHDVLPFALMVGVPARRLGWVCHCGEGLPPGDFQGERVSCATCGSRYHLEDEGDSPRLISIELVGGLESHRPGGGNNGEQDDKKDHSKEEGGPQS